MKYILNEYSGIPFDFKNGDKVQRAKTNSYPAPGHHFFPGLHVLDVRARPARVLGDVKKSDAEQRHGPDIFRIARYRPIFILLYILVFQREHRRQI